MRQQLGHTYRSRYNARVTTSDGQVATMSFNKTRDDTILKLSFFANMFIQGGSTTMRWYFLIDNQECTEPGKVEMTLQRSSHSQHYTPGQVLGLCQGTAAGRITQGQHRVAVNVSRASPGYGRPSTQTNWYSTEFIEIEVLCPQD